MKLTSTLRNLCLTLEYDGGAYHGWQIQNEAATIQGVVEENLSIITNGAVRLSAAGRTDAGVHALGQVANFKTPSRIPPVALHRGMNSLLPDDIAVIAVEEKELDFHSRQWAKSKIYRYEILNRPQRSALRRHYAWFLPRGLDHEAMAEAARCLVGELDFAAFCPVRVEVPSTVRRMMRCEVTRCGEDTVRIELEANGFLRYMARMIVGTLVEVGKSKVSPDAFAAIAASVDRRLAGPKAPGHGLCLVEVKY